MDAPLADADECLRRILLDARSHNAFRPGPPPLIQIEQAYELAKLGPTSMNCQPMRLVIVCGDEAKAKLAPALPPNNLDKTMSAPATAVVGFDRQFYRRLPELFPHKPVAHHFEGHPSHAEETAFRNGTLQAGYFLLALRAVGLDVGPMSGFDRAKVEEAFFPDGRIAANFLINVGEGSPSALFDRLPRLPFASVSEIA